MYVYAARSVMHNDMHMLKSPLLCAYDWIFMYVFVPKLAHFGNYFLPINIMAHFDRPMLELNKIGRNSTHVL